MVKASSLRQASHSSHQLMMHDDRDTTSSQEQILGWTTYSVFGISLTSVHQFINPLPVTVVQPNFTFVYTPQSSDEKTPVEGIACTEHSVLNCTDNIDFHFLPKCVVCRPKDPASSDWAEIHLLGTVMSLLSEARKRPALHAAATVIDQQAVGFMADSGCGKSTLLASFVQAGFPLLSDDLLVLNPHSDTVIAYPGYPQTRMWPDQANHFLGTCQGLRYLAPDIAKYCVPIERLGTFCRQPRPLAAIYLPQRAHSDQPIEITALSPSEALIELMNNSFARPCTSDTESQKRRMAMLKPIAQRVPVRRLLYPSGYELLPRVQAAVLEDLTHLS